MATDAVIETVTTPRRTKRRGRHPENALSAAFVRTAAPGRHADGNGLYLFVQPAGTRRTGCAASKVAEDARGIDGLRDAVAEHGNRLDRRFIR